MGKRKEYQIGLFDGIDIEVVRKNMTASQGVDPPAPLDDGHLIAVKVTPYMVFNRNPCQQHQRGRPPASKIVTAVFSDGNNYEYYMCASCAEAFAVAFSPLCNTGTESKLVQEKQAENK